MQEQVKEVVDAYQLEVALKLDAQKMYDDVSDHVQDIIIEKVEQETLFERLQVAYKAESANFESLRRKSKSLKEQYADQVQLTHRQAKEIEVLKAKSKIVMDNMLLPQRMLNDLLQLSPLDEKVQMLLQEI